MNDNEINILPEMPGLGEEDTKAGLEATFDGLVTLTD